MQIHFLGTNGFYTTPMGNTVCILIQTADANIVLDAGNGIYQLDKFIGAEDVRPIHLFLSHFHLDHTNGLHVLSQFRFKQGIKIWGQPGTKEILSRLIARPLMMPIENHATPIEIQDLQEGEHQELFSVKAKYLVHADSCFGYRFVLEGKNVAYCTDTGICDNLIELAREVDLLISECTTKNPASNTKWPHLSPHEAAAVAMQAEVKKLILTHFDPRFYSTLKDREWAQQEARRIFLNTVAAHDGMRIDL